jgi:hypothetical protein
VSLLQGCPQWKLNGTEPTESSRCEADRLLLRFLFRWSQTRQSLNNSGLNFIGFCSFSLQAFSPVIGDRSVNERSTIDAFPGVKDQKEIREAFQHHKSFAFWTLHLSLLNFDSKLLSLGAIFGPFK